MLGALNIRGAYARPRAGGGSGRLGVEYSPKHSPPRHLPLLRISQRESQGPQSQLLIAVNVIG